MTEHRTDGVAGRALSLGGRPVHERLSVEEAELRVRVLRRIQAEVADYRRLPVEEIRGDIAAITQDALRAFARSLREDRPLNDAELRQIGGSAARRAEEGFPLEAVLEAYHVGAREIFRTAAAGAGEGDVDDLAEIVDRVLRFVSAVTGAVTSGYLDQLRTKVGQEHTARRSLLSALLDGGAIDAAALATGITLPACYLVLCVELGRHPDEERPGVDATIAVRRKLRRFLGTFEQQCGEGVLASVDGSGGVVLVPLGGRLSEVDVGGWRELAGHAGRAAGATVTVAAETAPPSGVRVAAEQASAVLDVVRWFGREPGLYRLDDVLMEFQLTRPGAARDRLAAVVAPLEPHPDLFETLDCYLASEGNRRRTAASLHIHPNTVDYRLRRVRELTGIDPVQPAGLPRIIAALAARRAGGSTDRRGAGTSAPRR
ncbi:PucR family transcriptional regulator [Amycolatopsis sp. NPDC059027]|uniref:PucR family transcriptional regulator n=1 Tax=unclassified Amycolatopsis TaxID=2618356 RepID=UPI00366EDA57